ncbi:MAG TPA: PIN domain-containing protein [Bryobacteraceae bacterium]|nr:PIN domain-containing protein [Bryobacteraceae bacterium]
MARSTFVDTNVLIAAHRGTPEPRRQALAILEDPDRFFVASPFLQLEIVPKAIYHRQQLEVEFYQTFFDGVRIWINDLSAMVAIATEESERHGIAAMDALHIAAAYLGEAEVFYTLERAEKPIYRTNLVRVERIGAAVA